MHVRGRSVAALGVTVIVGAIGVGVWCGGVAQAAPPTGSVGIRLVDVPADAADEPAAQAYIVDDVAPGDTITRRVEVSNGTATELPIEVYAGAARMDGNQFVTLEQGERNALVGWTTVAPDNVAVAPGAAERARVTITVPEGTASGEHYGVVWAQPPASDAGGVTTVNRVGVRVYLSVESDGEGIASGAFPWLVIGIPALAILVGAAVTRSSRARRRHATG